MIFTWKRLRVQTPVARTAEFLRDQRYLENQMMEMMAGWILFIPETRVKVMLGEHLYQDGEHVDGLRTRLRELRCSPERDTPPSDDLARLCEKTWRAADTVSRLTALYQVLKPALLASYWEYSRLADPLVDAPTHRLLVRLLREEERQIREGLQMIDELEATVNARDAAEAWRAELQQALDHVGGIHTCRGPRGTYAFSKRFPKGIVPAREKPFWWIRDESDLPRPIPFTKPEGKILTMHTLLNGEIGTVERMTKIIAEFSDLPWPMRLALARQAWDEARHIEIVAATVRDLGGSWGQYPFNNIFWKTHVDRSDPLERLALGNAIFEGHLCSQLRDWIQICQDQKMTDLADTLDFLLADELPHVSNGKRWLPVVARNDPERRARVLAWAKEQGTHLFERFDATSAVTGQE